MFTVKDFIETLKTVDQNAELVFQEMNSDSRKLMAPKSITQLLVKEQMELAMGERPAVKQIIVGVA